MKFAYLNEKHYCVDNNIYTSLMTWKKILSNARVSFIYVCAHLYTPIDEWHSEWVIWDNYLSSTSLQLSYTESIKVNVRNCHRNKLSPTTYNSYYSKNVKGEVRANTKFVIFTYKYISNALKPCLNNPPS